MTAAIEGPQESTAPASGVTEHGNHRAQATIDRDPPAGVDPGVHESILAVLHREALALELAITASNGAGLRHDAIVRTLPALPRPGGAQDRRAREERALFERLATDHDPRDRAVLIERFLPLARSVAVRYRRSGEPLDDLLQVASMGLIKAIDRFDVDRKLRFSTYAVPTILGEIKRYFRDCTWAVHVPRSLQELSVRAERAATDRAEELRRQPSLAEISAAVGARDEHVVKALQAARAHRALSFEERCGADTDAATLGDCIGVDERGFDHAEERATVAVLLATVTSRDRDVLRMRFEEDMTQAEIGVVIGVGQMQVSRIIRQALERIRLAAAVRGSDGVACESDR
jgi:RNA polymerase sigma-B factor